MTQNTKLEVQELEDRVTPALHILFNTQLDPNLDPRAIQSLQSVVAPHLEVRLQQSRLAAQHVSFDNLTNKQFGLIDPTTDQVITPQKARAAGLANGLDVPEDTIEVFVGFNSSLGAGRGAGYGRTLFDGPGTSRGVGNVSGPNATHYAPWGGTIEFDANTSWNFLREGDPNKGFNFAELGGHELGHVLGFGGFGAADAWTRLVTAGKDAAGNPLVTTFNGPNAMRVYGQRNAGGKLLTIPLSTFDGGGHWADKLAKWSPTVGGFATMQESAAAHKTTEVFSDLDFAALADIGWGVAPLRAAHRR